MRDIKARLESGVATLALLDRRRLETGCPWIGYNLERMVIERELLELADEALALQPIARARPQTVKLRR